MPKENNLYMTKIKEKKRKKVKESKPFQNDCPFEHLAPCRIYSFDGSYLKAQRNKAE